MIKRLLVVGALSLSVSAMAAHHEETPRISEFYECSLNDGIAVSQVLDFARSDFKAFADKNDFAMNSFIWEAVAVSPPSPAARRGRSSFIMRALNRLRPRKSR